MCLCVSRSVVPDSLQPHGLYSLPGSSAHRILQARIQEWAANPFSRGSSQPWNQTWVSCITGRFFTNWATREAPYKIRGKTIVHYKWFIEYKNKQYFYLKCIRIMKINVLITQ